MHHVKLINDLKSKNSKLDFYTRQMKAMNRKQVPLCKKHHIGLHNDSWTDREKAIYTSEANKIRRLNSFMMKEDVAKVEVSKSK